jgi:hypothetical protein
MPVTAGGRGKPTARVNISALRRALSVGKDDERHITKRLRGIASRGVVQLARSVALLSGIAGLISVPQPAGSPVRPIPTNY